MIYKKTVFIVGAGASREVELPIGQALANKIADQIYFKPTEFDQRLPSEHIINRIVGTFPRAKQNKYLKIYLYETRDIRRRISFSNSIDNFLDVNQANEHIVKLGKLAIVKTILDAERSSTLYCDWHNRADYDFETLDKFWLRRLFKILQDEVRLGQEEKLFENVSFIVFNYDRCIEYFFLHALNCYYRMNGLAALEIVNKIKIIHPYGVVGKLDLQDQGDHVPFGRSIDDFSRLAELTNGLQTYTEQNRDQDQLKLMHSWLTDADLIVFLGFAFHEQNMNILSVPGLGGSVKGLFGTAFEIPAPSLASIDKRIRLAFSNNLHEYPDALPLHNDRKCFQLISDYSYVLSEKSWRSFD